jgi:hypothetical protein
MSQFSGDDTLITATPNSAFFMSLNCTSATPDCTGTVSQWINVSFPDFSRDSVKWDALYLVVAILMSRVITFLALTKLDYKAN